MIIFYYLQHNTSSKTIIKLFLRYFWRFWYVDIPMEGMICIIAIPVFSSMVVSLQSRMRVPSMTVKLSVISGKSAALGHRLPSFWEFVGRPEARTKQASRIFKMLMSRRFPLICLCNKLNTFQPGWALWREDFPYLLLEATLLLSINASLLRLSPVVDNPWIFFPSLSWAKLSLAVAEKVLAWMFSTFAEGMYPV